MANESKDITWTDLIKGLPDPVPAEPSEKELSNLHEILSNLGLSSDYDLGEDSEKVYDLDDPRFKINFPDKEELDKRYKEIMENFKSSEGFKLAYPNNQFMNIPGSHNLDKWLTAVNRIYYDVKKGEERNVAIREATAGWKTMEVYDFLNWLKYYEGGNQLKYKKAQKWYGDADIGYLLPIKNDKQPAKEESSSDPTKGMSKKKREEIENQRKKIIGRLDSAEKLIRSLEGQDLAEDQFESLLKTLHELKQKIYMVNKKSTSSKLYEDMIVREANRLTHNGHGKAAGLLLYSLHKVSAMEPVSGEGAKQEKSAPPKDNAKEKVPAPASAKEEKKDAIPAAKSPAEPTNMSVDQGSGEVGGLPSVGPGMVPPQNNPPKPVSPGIAEFMQGLSTSLKTDEELEVNDNDDDLYVEAQVESPAPRPIPPPNKDLKDENLEIKEEEIGSKSDKDLDKMVETLFSNLTMNDIVAKFEDIAKFYKTREMARQLSLADMMLDSKGLSPFFPSLSEATNKALEANNYILTRIEDIISKLRGTLKTRDIDMTGEEKEGTPEIEKVKDLLEEKERKEEARKAKRQEEAEKEVPEVEMDLKEPAPIPPPAPPAPKPA